MIDKDLLIRYFRSPIPFRREVRKFGSGWAFDGLSSYPEEMIGLTSGSGALARLEIALDRGYLIGHQEYFGILENWCWQDLSFRIYHRGFFRHLDSYFFPGICPCWIPGNLKEILSETISIYYWLMDRKFDYDDHYFSYDFRDGERKEIMIIGEGKELEIGVGSSLLEAGYDLYEKVWLRKWKREMPSITEVKGFLDSGKGLNEDKFLLIDYDVGREFFDAELVENYEVGYQMKYQHDQFDISYHGSFKFIEGEFEVFFNYFDKIGSVDDVKKSLLKRGYGK